MNGVEEIWWVGACTADPHVLDPHTAYLHTVDPCTHCRPSTTLPRTLLFLDPYIQALGQGRTRRDDARRGMPLLIIIT